MGQSEVRQTEKQVQETDPQVVNIPRGQITISKYAKRHSSDKGIDQLVKNIREVGLLQYGIARPLAEETYELLAGTRRFRATGRLDWEMFPCRVVDVDDEKASLIAYASNAPIKKLTAKDKAHWFRYQKEDFQKTEQEIANDAGCSQSVVSKYLSIAELPAEVIERIKEEKPDGQKRDFTFTHAEALARIMRTDRPHKEDEVRQLSEKPLSGRISTKEFRKQVKFITDGHYDELPEDLQHAFLTNPLMTAPLARLYLQPSDAVQGQGADADIRREKAKQIDYEKRADIIRDTLEKQKSTTHAKEAIRAEVEDDSGSEDSSGSVKSWSTEVRDGLSEAVQALGYSSGGYPQLSDCNAKEIEQLKKATEQLQKRLNTFQNALESY